MTLAIGLLLSSGFPVQVPFVLSFIDLYSRLLTDPNSPAKRIALVRSEGFPVDAARNDVIREALKSDASHLLFLDADMTFPSDLPARLLAHDVPVVTARYHMRRPPFKCVGMVRHPRADKAGQYQSVHYGAGLVEIDRGGAGALLIRRDVLLAIGEHTGGVWFRYQRNPDWPHDMTVSEDFWFFEQAQRAGYKTYLDWDCVCGHVTQIVVDEKVADGALDMMRQQWERMEGGVKQDVLDSLVVRNRPHPWLQEQAHVTEVTP